jgi:hypothetical protein
MYFIYEKPMLVATSNYNINSIVEWFAELDLTELWEDLKKANWLSPEQIANDILVNTGWWSFDFREWCQFTEDENENISDQELYEQLTELVEPALAKYFREHWLDLTNNYDTNE